jgi:biotin carboxyl carrier protein
LKYFAHVEGRTLEIRVEENRLLVDGVHIEAALSTLPGSDRHQLCLDGRSVSLSGRRGPGGWIIELEGRSFLVRVEDERVRHISQLAAAARPVTTEWDLRAPMPGLIVRVEVEPGEKVRVGAGLVVMEAMKMENELCADVAGWVASVEVEAGQTVNRDEVLLRLEQRSAR